MRNVLVAEGILRHPGCRNVVGTLALTFRAAKAPDAEPLARAVIEGFELYREFAAPGWEPPPLADEIALQRELLADETTWCRLAEAEGRIVGQVTFLPAERAAVAVAEPSLAHLRNLFVDRPYWGSGLARELHDAAVAEARPRGFEHMRLFTPARHGRARRFYEREGWSVAGDEFYAEGPALVIVEYRRMAG
jgi:GNAT superfamily N-acetyltransferase